MSVDLPGPMGNSSGTGKAVIVLGDCNLVQSKFDRAGVQTTSGLHQIFSPNFEFVG